MCSRVHRAFPSLGSGPCRHSLILVHLAGVSKKSLLMVEIVPSYAWPSVAHKRESPPGNQRGLAGLCGCKKQLCPKVIRSSEGRFHPGSGKSTS